jgi:hypothetical protein
MTSLANKPCFRALRRDLAFPSGVTVLKKWFERPNRLPAFALWVARRAISRKGTSAGQAAKLFREAAALLSAVDDLQPALSASQREDAQAIHGRLQAFQNEYRDYRWGLIRTINNWNLFLVEKAVALLLYPPAAPTAGYTLAADYCQHYDPHFGNGLNGPSQEKIMEIVRWMFKVEALEDDSVCR